MIYTKTQEVFKRLFDMKNGKDSRIVLERQKEISKLESDASKLGEEVEIASKENTNLQATLRAVTRQYDNLKELIKGKKSSDYEELNRELQISFDPTALRKDLDEKFPVKSKELTEKINSYEEEIKNKNSEISKLRSEVEEKSLQMSTILDKQKEMIELLKKSVSGDLLNFSPRPIIDTLKFLNFNDEEAKMLASNLIFSNPDFINYYKTLEEPKKEEYKEEYREVKPIIEEEKEVIPVKEEKEVKEDNFREEVINVFKEEEVKEETSKELNEEVIEYLKTEFNASREDILEYKDAIKEINVKEAVDKLKSNNIDVDDLSLIVLTNVDNFISNVNVLSRSGKISDDDLVKYSAKLTLLPNAKVSKYVNEYRVIYRYPQGNLFMGIFDVSENVVASNANGLVKVDPSFFMQYPQFQVSNCDAITDVINTCVINNLDYQDEDGNYYMFVFDTKEFSNMYPDVKIVPYKG